MAPSFATSLDALGGWRGAGAAARRPGALPRRARPLDGAAAGRSASLRERLGNEKLVRRLRRRVLARQVGADQRDLLRRHRPPHPAGDAGRTTMCPVELGWTTATSRRALRCCRSRRGSKGCSLAELRAQPRRLAPPAARRQRPRAARAVAARGHAHRVGRAGARRARSASGTTPRPTTTRRATTTAGSRCRRGAMR